MSSSLASRSILRSILQRKCSSLEPRKYGSVLRDLFDIVRYAVVPRAWARGIFEECWGWFMERDMEEMLIPIGMALAWSIATAPVPAPVPGDICSPDEEAQQEQGQEHAKLKHLDEAIVLLEDIWKGSTPFGWTNLPFSFEDFPLRDEGVTAPAWPLMYPLAALLVKLYALLPGARGGGSGDDNDNHKRDGVHIANSNNSPENSDDRSPAREEILKMVRPRYDDLYVAVVAGIDIYIDTRTYQDGHGHLARNGVQFMNDPRQLSQGGLGGDGRLRYSARPEHEQKEGKRERRTRPAGNLFMFWMRIRCRPRFLPVDGLSVDCDPTDIDFSSRYRGDTFN
ncbi:predicted protein [Histoplasma capsulatum var. duboisii H88]|uniref:Predicted protein n=1 Tax=Ajellomyces capsulatus (strain H88) TaxID=544711 RepID=F0U7W5_AJEC8|nr:predicted protein [Histoplasma capsulatum var. duboisii H88]